MKKNGVLVILFFILFAYNALGQMQATMQAAAEKQWLKGQVNILTDTSLHGRGYIKNGKDIASKYIQKKFKDFKLKGFGKDGNYVQGYAFPVNTFPEKMKLSINGKELVPGEDYLIDAYSSSFEDGNLKVEKVDVSNILDTVSWNELIIKFDTTTAYYFDDITRVCNALNTPEDKFAYLLPRGCFIVKEKNKLMWTVKKEAAISTVFHVKEAAIPKKLLKVDAEVTAQYVSRMRSENIIGYLPGEVKDTFIAFTAHYDHLGMMGDATIFPGASDNASGMAMLLYLANYYSTHPQHYSILFIAFAGEEAGLMGSTFYTMHPIIPLKNIKFLTNIDIMGDATDGITVVNATEFPKEFETLQQINKKNKYLPVIKSRGKAHNSDHAMFYEAGVPSFFFYSNGGKGFYHDIYDNSKELSFTFIDGVEKLIIDFVKAIK